MDETLKEEKAKAFLPFAMFCIALIGVYITVTIDIINRPIPKPAPKDAQGQPAPMEGKKAPDFELADINGNTVKLSDHFGKIIFVNIWATWCVPCRDEMPSMQKLYDELKGPGFEMLAVSIDEDGAKSVKPFVDEFKITFPVLLSPEKKNGAYQSGGVAENYMITGVPESYIISQEGVVLHHVVGPADWSKKEIVELMKLYVSRANPKADKAASPY